jgi:hypothetical protein
MTTTKTILTKITEKGLKLGDLIRELADPNAPLATTPWPRPNSRTCKRGTAQAQQQQQQQLLQHASASADPPLPLKPPFVPKFKGATEMDEHRRLRLQARRGAAGAVAAATADATAVGSVGGATSGIRVVGLLEGGATVDLMSSGEEGREEEEESEELEEEEEVSFSQVGDEDFNDVVDVGSSVDIDEDEFDRCVVMPSSYIPTLTFFPFTLCCHPRTRAAQ